MSFKSVIGVILMVAITVILAVVITAFVFGLAGSIQDPDLIKTDVTGNSCLIEDYGNGTLWFHCQNSVFAPALSKYIGEHNVTVLTFQEQYNGGNIVVVKANVR